jgi:hypothetical protein
MVRPAAMLLLLTLASPAAAADAVLYRIFLRDGSTLVSYGEFARVGDQVVFSIPIGGLETPSPQLQLVTLSESVVDLERTESYAQAARAQRYAETRGESDFALLSNEVARTLNDVALTPDPVKRLALADQARRALADWPARNYGYRASDVAQLSSMLDEVVSELRVAAGQSRFDLSLVATTAPPPPVPLLPAPTLRESIEQAFTVARITPDIAQRVSLLNAITGALSDPSTTAGWAVALRTKASADLATEVRLDQAYADLSDRIMTAAEIRRRRADVKGMEALVREVLKADDRLGRARPQATSALLATLDARLNDTRRLRLARDTWALRLDLVKAYERRAHGMMDVLVRLRPSLEQIRQLAGPPPKTLAQFQRRTSSAARELSLVKPAPEVESIHGLLTSAFQMAVMAGDARARAVRSADMNIAWQASSAAAGALMLFDRARDELQKLMTPPTQ